MLRIGSLFSGYGGLDLAAEEALGGRVVWQAENDRAASAVLAARFPGVPNLGDVRRIDWRLQERVDALVGGFPCQDVSLAGRRDGMQAGNRSGLWAEFARAIEALGPELVLIENVPGLRTVKAGDPKEDEGRDENEQPSYSALEQEPGSLGGPGRLDRPVLRALGAVLGDLASLGFDAEWESVRASDVGASHRRERLFVLAWPAPDPGLSARLDGG